MLNPFTKYTELCLIADFITFTTFSSPPMHQPSDMVLWQFQLHSTLTSLLFGNHDNHSITKCFAANYEKM